MRIHRLNIIIYPVISASSHLISQENTILQSRVATCDGLRLCQRPKTRDYVSPRPGLTTRRPSRGRKKGPAHYLDHVIRATGLHTQKYGDS